MTRRVAGHRRVGFSLVELMVVVVILGMMTGVAVLSWKSLLPNQELNTAIRELSDLLHGTRSEAIARSREFRIYYDLDNDSYAVRTPFLAGGGIALTDEDQERLWTNQTDFASKGIDIVSVRIDDELYSDGRVFVRFDALGSSSYHTIVLRQTMFERDFTIEALPLTGDIRFHEGVYEREIADEGDFAR